MRLIFGWMASSINKICVIGQTAIHTYSMSHHYIPKRLRFGAILWAAGVIGPYFLRDDQHRHVTVNGNRYRSITESLNGWYGLGGQVVPTGQATQRMSQSIYWKANLENFGEWSSRWLPRSCDLTPFDYFLWGYVKSMVYANKSATIDELRTNSEREIAAVSADLSLKIGKNWVQRQQACSWWPCKRNRILLIMASNVFLQQ